MKKNFGDFKENKQTIIHITFELASIQTIFDKIVFCFFNLPLNYLHVSVHLSKLN